MSDFRQQPRGYLEAEPDPTLAALGVLRQARGAYSEGLRNLDEALLSSQNPANKALLAWDLYRLQDLEAEEAKAASALLDAEKAVLNTPPTTLAGSIAVLNFLHDYLKGEPDIALAARGVAHVTAALSAIA
jgi:hypothetical protein